MSYRQAVPETVTSRDSAATRRAAAGSPRRSAGGPPLKTKAEKRAEAKAAKARARVIEKRKQTLTVAGSGLAVVALVVGLVWWIGSSEAPETNTNMSTPSAAATIDPGATADPTAETPAAFPPVPAGADPALSTKPAVGAGKGKITELKTTTLIEGTGDAVQAGQTINVNYVGVTYADGKEFDTSWKRKEAFSFQVGTGSVIKGWDEGLIGVKVGSRVQLDIPADMAYGESPQGGQPAGTLRFVVDVLSAA